MPERINQAVGATAWHTTCKLWEPQPAEAEESRGDLWEPQAKGGTTCPLYGIQREHRLREPQPIRGHNVRYTAWRGECGNHILGGIDSRLGRLGCGNHILWESATAARSDVSKGLAYEAACLKTGTPSTASHSYEWSCASVACMSPITLVQNGA